MAYRVGSVADKLQYGTLSIAADQPVMVELIGEVRRVTRREKIRVSYLITPAEASSSQIIHEITNSNRYVLDVQGATVARA
mgnify:CR=1 FL=1